MPVAHPVEKHEAALDRHEKQLENHEARFAEYDTAIAMLTRAERLGDATATAKIAAWDAYAVKLQEVNDVPGWYKAPVSANKPGV